MGTGQHWSHWWVQGNTGHAGGYRVTLVTLVGTGQHWSHWWVQGNTGHAGGYRATLVMLVGTGQHWSCWWGWLTHSNACKHHVQELVYQTDMLCMVQERGCRSNIIDESLFLAHFVYADGLMAIRVHVISYLRSTSACNKLALTVNFF